ncbi:SDR family NAD(P)-dependent oxidoreductase [Sphingomonas oryzagri]|uniref:SDR family oxidoreductase n=1 Tax=Sphingomonas oryzagri TaxID=3042314 RepID=A0ABT6MWH5_9SPHN|nr:SDR family oxidoreductase [Sphingomonas oryzagri]MDH7637340.1 SDR family oxidoreductase [Sphingomonas oryzagri]
MAASSPPLQSARLSGRVALVTGALGGIGAAIAARFASEGASVWLADLAPDGVDRAREIAGDGARYLRLDVTCEADWQAAAKHIGGSLDILVNNAGIAPTGDVADMPVDDWRRAMRVNAEGAFLGARTMRPLLAEAGGGGRGWASVISISSILGMVGMAQSSAYAASKGAVRMLSRSLAVEFASAGLPIRVNSVHPGFVRTAMTERGSAEMDGEGDLLAALAAMTPMRRLATAGEIAAAVLFLGSDESSFITGAELVVDGGWTAR